MIRAAREQDLPRIMAIYDAARRYMRQNGNPTQWGDNYPPESMLRQDIACGRLFVMEDAGGVYAVFAFLLGTTLPTPTSRGRGGTTAPTVRCTGWAATAPTTACSRRARRGRRGGVPICGRTPTPTI